MQLLILYNFAANTTATAAPPAPTMFPTMNGKFALSDIPYAPPCNAANANAATAAVLGSTPTTALITSAPTP